MAIKLIVYTDPKTFNSYWYGYGNIEGIPFDENEKGLIVVNYEDDEYHAKYQEGRFASGLIFAKLETI